MHKAGYSNEEIGETLGDIKGSLTNGTMLNTKTSGRALYALFKNANALDQLEKQGVSKETLQRLHDGTAGQKDFEQIAIAVQGLKNLETKTTVNGMNVSATFDNEGNIRHYSQDSSSTFKAGTQIDFRSVDSLFGLALHPGDSSTKVGALGATRDAVNLVKSFVTRTFKSARDEKYAPASEYPKGAKPTSYAAQNYRRVRTENGWIYVSKKEDGFSSEGGI